LRLVVRRRWQSLPANDGEVRLIDEALAVLFMAAPVRLWVQSSSVIDAVLSELGAGRFRPCTN